MAVNATNFASKGKSKDCASVTLAEFGFTEFLTSPHCPPQTVGSDRDKIREHFDQRNVVVAERLKVLREQEKMSESMRMARDSR